MTLSFGNCVNGLQYFANSTFHTFDFAQAGCEVEGGTLAIPNNEFRFAQMGEVYQDELAGLQAFIGLRDLNDVGGTSGTRFLRLDGTENPFTAVDQGEGIWAALQPNDFQNQNCAFTNSGVDIEDISCGDTGTASLCQRSCVDPQVSFGGCQDGLEYFVIKEELNSNAAKRACARIDNGELAVPFSEESFNRIRRVYEDAIFKDTFGLLGLEDLNDVGGTDGSRFIKLDGTENEFTAVPQGQGIWGEDQPNDFNENQNCVFTRNVDTIRDGFCNNLYFPICQRECVDTTFSFSFGSCNNGIQYFANKANLPANFAQSACESQGGELAIPTSQEAFDEMKKIYDDALITENAFIGLREVRIGEGTSGERFLTLNGDVNGFTAVDQSQGIWNLNQPSGEALENCVFMNGDGIEDTFCDATNVKSICQRSCEVEPTRFAFGECEDGIEYFFNKDALTFNAANDVCKSAGGHLAIPSSEERFTQMGNDTLVSNIATYLGLRDFEDTTGEGERFQDINGNVNDFTAVGRGEGIWRSQQPNNLNGNQNCVFTNNAVEIEDETCDRVNTASLCERECATENAFSFGKCESGGIQYFTNSATLTFNAAQTACQSQGGKLAIPSSQDRFDQMTVEFFDSVGITQAFVGLRDFADVGGSDGRRFLDVDGNTNGFTAVNRGVGIWQTDEPNNANSAENCVITVNGVTIQDVPCNEPGTGSICERPCIEPSFGGCQNELEYYVINDGELSFEAARKACKKADENGKLAIPSSLENFKRMGNVHKDVLGSGKLAFVGLVDANDIGGTSGIRFVDVDGNINLFTAVDQGEGIWANGQPNDFNNNQNCVATRDGDTIEDLSCNDLSFALCERECVDPEFTFTFGRCRNELEYFANDADLLFNTAQEACESQGGSLAIPSSQQAFDEIIRLYDEVFDGESAYLGLRDSSVGSGTLGSRFRTVVEGDQNQFTAVNQGEFPWKSDQPSGEVNENCVFLKDGEIEDTFCNAENVKSICQRSCVEPPGVFSFGGCQDNLEYFFNKELLTFDDAQHECEREGGKLAIPSSEERFAQMGNDTLIFAIQTYVGLRDFNDIGGRTGTRFQDIDGNQNDFTHLENTGQGIWRSGQPNDDQGNQNCAISKTSDTIEDASCNLVNTASLCQRECVSDENSNVFSFGECERGDDSEGIQFFTNTASLTFNAAQAACVSQGGKLAIPTSQDSFEKLTKQFLQSEGITQAFVGLRDFADAGGNDGNRFLNVDNNENSFTAVARGVGIWKNNEPNNANTVENCVITVDGVTIEDVPCNEPGTGSICQRSCVLEEEEENDDEALQIEIIAGAAAGGVAVLVAIIIFIIVVVKKKKGNDTVDILKI